MVVFEGVLFLLGAGALGIASFPTVKLIYDFLELSKKVITFLLME